MSSVTPDLDGALKGLFRDREWPLKILMGGFINMAALALTMVNAVFLPVSFGLTGLTAGYLLRVQRLAIKGELEKLPDWTDVLDLLVSGLSWQAVCLGFGFFTMSAMALSLLVASATAMIKMSNPAYLAWAVGTFLLVYTLAVIFKFFLAALMANFAEEERMMAGFAWRKVAGRIVQQPGILLVAWLAGLTITASAIIILLITRLGIVLIPFCYFLSEVISARMIGQAWASSLSNGQQRS